MTQIEKVQPDAGGNAPDQQKSDPQGGGEDESSSSQDGNEDHLHDDQKPLNDGPESSKSSGDASRPEKPAGPSAGLDLA